MTGGAIVFEHEQRCDSMLSESDLPRLEKEINHNIKKQERIKRNLEKGLRADGEPLVRDGDGQQHDNLLANDINGGRNGAAGANINGEGFIIPQSMRNY